MASLPSDYSEIEILPDGSAVEIRALAEDDRAGMLAAVDRMSERSLYQRFFAFKRCLTEREIEFYVDIDFTGHVALVAVLEEDGQPLIVGGGRYIVVRPGRAEVAIAVDDAHQGRGIGGLLLHHLAVLARRAGIRELVADILPENRAMMKLCKESGLGMKASYEPGTCHVTLQLR